MGNALARVIPPLALVGFGYGVHLYFRENADHVAILGVMGVSALLGFFVCKGMS